MLIPPAPSHVSIFDTGFGSTSGGISTSYVGPTRAPNLNAQLNTTPNFSVPSTTNYIVPLTRELLSGRSETELALQIDTRLRHEAAIKANAANFGVLRPLTPEQYDASRFAALARQPLQTREERIFVDSYANVHDPFAFSNAAINVMASLVGGYTPKNTPLSARQTVRPQEGKIRTTFGGPYSYLPDPENVAPGKAFSPAQRQLLYNENQFYNSGEYRSNQSGTRLVLPKQYSAGTSPPPNEAQVDHIVPRAQGGTNSFNNAQILSRQENQKKGKK